MDASYDTTLYLVLVVLGLFCLGLNVISIPGNWLLYAGAMFVSFSRGWERPGILALVLFGVILLLGEVMETGGSIFGARRFGASRPAMIWAVVGGVIGGILGTPIPLIGNIIGAILGVFVAALVTELVQGRSLEESAHSGVGAAIGRAIGLGAKLSTGFILWSSLLWLARPIRWAWF